MKEVEMLKRGSKQPNILINNLLEESQEKTSDSRIKLVQAFFKNQMEIKQEIPIKQAFRFGTSNPRTMMVILDNPDDKFDIFSHSANLKGKRNARKKLFQVNSDQTEQEREARKYYLHLQRENKQLQAEDQLKISLKKGRLFVNNTMVNDKIKVPNAMDILTLENDEILEIKDTRTYEAGSHEENDSEFFCYYQRVKSEKDVQQGIAKMKIKHGDASHVVTAYRLAEAKGPFKQGFQDDNEFSAGRVMLETLKKEEMEEIAVYIYICRYSGPKMGPRRFEIYSQLTTRAAKMLRNKLSKLERANRLRRSNSQLSQLSQLSMEDETAMAADGEQHMETENTDEPFDQARPQEQQNTVP